MTHIDLFAGIGGFSLAARWAGWETVAWCEWDKYCQTVLRYHFPKADELHDIDKTDFTHYANRIDILTGGFPCQEFSIAGKRKGTAGDRYKWPQMFRAVREIRPRWIVPENVRGIINWGGGVVFRQVQTDLETEGYEIIPFLLPAAGVNAPHERYRIWFVAHRCERNESPADRTDTKRENCTENGRKFFNESSDDDECGITSYSNSLDRGRGATGKNRQEIDNNNSGNASNPNGKQRCEGGMYAAESKTPERYAGPFYSRDDRENWENFPAQSPLYIRNDGLSAGLVGITVSKWRNQAIKSCGNSIVPQVAYQIFTAINEYEKLYNQ